MNLRLTERIALSEVRDYLHRHYRKKLTIKQLSKLEWGDISFNALRLQNGFKLMFRQTIHEYQTSLRMQQAIELLSSTDLSIKAIAVTVGYPGNHKFAPVFKKYYAVTASQYRERILTEQDELKNKVTSRYDLVTDKFGKQSPAVVSYI